MCLLGQDEEPWKTFFTALNTSLFVKKKKKTQQQRMNVLNGKERSGQNKRHLSFCFVLFCNVFDANIFAIDIQRQPKRSPKKSASWSCFCHWKKLRERAVVWKRYQRTRQQGANGWLKKLQKHDPGALLSIWVPTTATISNKEQKSKKRSTPRVVITKIL